MGMCFLFSSSLLSLVEEQDLLTWGVCLQKDFRGERIRGRVSAEGGV